MSDIMRALCVLGSVITFAYFCFKVRKEQMRIGDTVFWLTFALGLVALGIFPRILTQAAEFLGIISPVNGLFLGIIFIVLIKLFTQTVRLSDMNRKLEILAQEIALMRARYDAREPGGSELSGAERSEPRAPREISGEARKAHE